MLQNQKWFNACNPCTDFHSAFLYLSCPLPLSLSLILILSSSFSLTQFLPFSLFLTFILISMISSFVKQMHWNELKIMRSAMRISWLNYAIHTNRTLKHFLIRCSLQKKGLVPWCVCVFIFFLFCWTFFQCFLTVIPSFSLSLQYAREKNGRTSCKNSTVGSDFEIYLKNGLQMYTRPAWTDRVSLMTWL